MRRRKFLKSMVVGSTAVGLGAYTWVKASNASDLYTIEFALDLLEKIHPEIEDHTHFGTWSASKTFQHCAQSIQYSMLGYPTHHTQLFKSSLGQAAFSLFKAKGSMNHNLEEDIPGSEFLDSSMPVLQAFKKLQDALMTFQSYQGELKEHFSYGELNKRDYEIAHVLHVLNHLEVVYK